jgi:bifunctional DNA-binding transcriptional regulator/antitoxin component of YhaV-PrlF toxin-antitoxin module
MLLDIPNPPEFNSVLINGRLTIPEKMTEDMDLNPT